MTFTALLLVGGESRRAGRCAGCRNGGADKATLILEGENLWQKQLQLLRAFEPEALWISARICPVWCPLEIEAALATAMTWTRMGGAMVRGRPERWASCKPGKPSSR